MSVNSSDTVEYCETRRDRKRVCVLIITRNVVSINARVGNGYRRPIIGGTPVPRVE